MIQLDIVGNVIQTIIRKIEDSITQRKGINERAFFQR